MTPTPKSTDTREALADKLRGYIGQVEFARRPYVLLTTDEAKTILAALTEQPAAPQGVQAEPLTDAQIDKLRCLPECWVARKGAGSFFQAVPFARAIERAHGIGSAPAAPAQEPQQPSAVAESPSEFDEIRSALEETYRFASTSRKAQENINFVLESLDTLEAKWKGGLKCGAPNTSKEQT